jgi:hypothetical protein
MAIFTHAPDSGKRPASTVYLCRAWVPATGERCRQWVSDGKDCPNEGQHSDLIMIKIGRAELTIDPAHVAFRLFQELIADALPEHWRREAERWDVIAGTPALPLIVAPSTLARAPEAARIALACRRKAWVLEEYGLPDFVSEEIAAVLDEEAA